jgi:hypothetical protein
MRLPILTIVLISVLSCGTENQYFKKSLTADEKATLKKGEAVTKSFNGQANWYKQYWTGQLLISKTIKTYNFKQIGEWRQTSKDGKELYTITNFDNQGYLQDEIILGFDGTAHVETKCTKDSLNNKVIVKCDAIWKYADTKTIRLKSKSIVIDGKNYKHGTWEYYSKTGDLEKIENYSMNKRTD